MGVIKAKYSLLAPSKAGKRLFETWGEVMIDNGVTEGQAKLLCNRIARMACSQMNKQYVVMGGYSPDDQLFDAAQKLMNQLDESEELEKLLINLDEPTEESIDVAEPDLEDAYNAADSIAFIGTEKQVKWARDIAVKSDRTIALSGLSFEQLPRLAKWWIDNRTDIYSALKEIK